jgi:hypothetical protein
MRIAKIGILVPFVLASTAGSAPAQELAGLNKRLFDAVTINATSPVAGGNHASHFFLGGENLTLAVRQLNVSLASQITTFPLASSSGGFSYATQENGQPIVTSTFGPLFAERAFTIGRRKLNFGYTFQATTYDSFEGESLEDNGIRFISQHNDCCPAAGPNNPPNTTDFTPDFERDLLLSTLDSKIQTRTNAFFANYGVTNRFDVGVAIPIVSVDVESSVTGQILRTATVASPLTHSYDGLGADSKTVSESGSATGLGDILLRAKYNVYQTPTMAFAGALDLRLPSGDEDQLLGTGATQVQPFFIASGEFGRFSSHVNFGYTFSNGDTSEDAADVDDPVGSFGAPAANVDEDPLDLSVPDEINYTFGVAVKAHSRVSVGFDVRGRTLRDVPRFSAQDTTYLNRAAGTLPTTAFVATDELAVEEAKGNLTQVLGVVGGKVRLADTLLLNVTLLFSMSDAGLKPKPTPVFGFDYVF